MVCWREEGVGERRGVGEGRVQGGEVKGVGGCNVGEVRDVGQQKGRTVVPVHAGHTVNAGAL